MLIARVLSVADTWDAMTSDRPYRKGFPDEKALGILREVAGTQLDPDVVQAFFTAWRAGVIFEAAELGGPALRSRYLRRPTGAADSILRVALSR